MTPVLKGPGLSFSDRTHRENMCTELRIRMAVSFVCMWKACYEQNLSAERPPAGMYHQEANSLAESVIGQVHSSLAYLWQS